MPWEEREPETAREGLVAVVALEEVVALLTARVAELPVRDVVPRTEDTELRDTAEAEGRRDIVVARETGIEEVARDVARVAVDALPGMPPTRPSAREYWLLIRVTPERGPWAGSFAPCQRWP